MASTGIINHYRNAFARSSPTHPGTQSKGTTTISRVASLVLQLTLLIIAIGLVVVLHDGVWASDTIVIWTAVVAAVLSSIVISQIWMVVRSSERAKIAKRGKRHQSKKRAQSDQRQVPPAASKAHIVNHTQRFRRSMGIREQARRQSEREESRLLNIEADIRVMNETRSKW